MYSHHCFFCAQNISDDHPAVAILHDLETTTYYVDKNSSDSSYMLARTIIQTILKWTNMLNSRLKVGALYVVCTHFSDKTS